MLNYIFIELRKGFVVYMSVLRMLLEDELMVNWVGYMCCDLWKLVVYVVDVMKKWFGSEELMEMVVNYVFE